MKKTSRIQVNSLLCEFSSFFEKIMIINYLYLNKRLKQNGKISGEKLKMSKVIRRTTAVNK